MLTIIIVAAMALAVLVWLRRARTTAGRSGRLMPEALVHVSFDDGEIVCTHPESTVRRVAWAEITRVGLRTTSEGPWLPDVFWSIHAGHDEPAIVFPQGATGEPELLQAFQRRLPGFDDGELIRAMGTTTDRTFLLWSRITDATQLTDDLPRGKPALVDHSPVILAVGSLLELASLALAVRLWRGAERVGVKLLWTAILAVPFFGIVAFAVWHDPPTPSDPIDRPIGRDWDQLPPPRS